MKTSVMALDLAVSGVLTWILCKDANGNLALRQFAKSAALFVSGLAMVPGVLLLRFAAEGALGNLYYCLIRHNLIAASERTKHLDFRGIATLAALAGIVWWSRAGFCWMARNTRGLCVLLAANIPYKPARARVRWLSFGRKPSNEDLPHFIAHLLKRNGKAGRQGAIIFFNPGRLYRPGASSKRYPRRYSVSGRFRMTG